jgi:crooked neck
VWTLYAQFEVRQLRLDKARKIFGTAIGMCPKEKLFKEYITLELQLREFDRCRQIYEKYLAVGDLPYSPKPVNADTFTLF